MSQMVEIVSEPSPTKNLGEYSDTQALHAHFCPNFQSIYHDRTLFYCSFPHFSLISLPQYATQCHDMLHRGVFLLKIRYAFSVSAVKAYLVDRNSQFTLTVV